MTTLVRNHGATRMRQGTITVCRQWYSFLAALLLVLGATSCQRESVAPLAIQDVRYWKMPRADRKVPAPRSLAVSEHEVFVIDTAGRLLVFSLDGELIRQWTMPESEVGNPEDILLLRDGRIAVADTHYHRIIFFDAHGAVLATWGERGEGPGQFIYPVALAEDPAGNLYVGEYGGNDRVQKFDLEGNVIATFGRFGLGEGEFQRPSGLAWSDGLVFVADAINDRIHRFRDDGTFDGMVSEQGLAYPYDLDIGRNGDLVLVEYRGGSVTRLLRNGEIVGRWGSTGSGLTHLATPWGLAVGNRSIYVADTGNRRIVELRL